MPSLAPANNATQLAAVGVSAPQTDAGATQQAVTVGEKADSLPVSRPEADAVLHLPSQPSGSQHAAHPHGTQRPPYDPPGVSAKGQQTSSAVSATQHGKPVQAHVSGATDVAADADASDSQECSKHPPAAAATVTGAAGASETQQDRQQQPGAAAKGKEEKGTADESGQSILLDSGLGHDDDDSC